MQFLQAQSFPIKLEKANATEASLFYDNALQKYLLNRSDCRPGVVSDELIENMRRWTGQSISDLPTADSLQSSIDNESIVLTKSSVKYSAISTWFTPMERTFCHRREGGVSEIPPSDGTRLSHTFEIANGKPHGPVRQSGGYGAYGAYGPAVGQNLFRIIDFCQW